MLPLHYVRMGGASWNRTTMIPASTGCSRTISAKAPGSLYESRTHPPGSKDQCPNQLGEQTIFADEERFELSTPPLTGERSTTELFILFIRRPDEIRTHDPPVKSRVL